MNPEETDPSPGATTVLSDKPEPAVKISVFSLTRTIRATIPSKTRKYDTSQAVEELYRTHADSFKRKEGEVDLYEKAAFEIYAIYRPRIVRIARKYSSLSAIFGEEDLQQEALIAILQALRKYRHSPHIRMKFSTYLEWSIRNIFQRAIGCRDKYVEIYGHDGAFVKTMGYSRFIEQKKALEGAGYTYTTKKRFCYLSEVQQDDDLKARLDQTALAPYEYSTRTEAAEEHTETQKSEEGKEPEEEPRDKPETPIPHNRPASGIGLNQQIDSLYRQWARSRKRSGVTESDPVVLRIYDLCHERAEEMLLPFRNNGTSVDAEEVDKCLLSAIVRGLAGHDDGAVPHVPFYLSLKVAMKRSVEVLRKRQSASQQGGTQCVPEK